MKKILLSLFAIVGLVQASAADLEWLTDFEKAKAKAKEEKKAILMDFTGSDWCPPCIALHKNVFSTKEFAEFAKKHLVLVELDFPRRKKQSDELKRANQELMRKFAVEAYPTVILLSTDGKELVKKTGYGGDSAKDYIAMLEKKLAPVAGRL